MTRRRTLTGKARLALLNAHASRCHICGGAIEAGQRWEVEHVIPLAMGGTDEPDNMRPAHAKCHREKTAKDVPAIAKAKRVEIAHRGAKAPKSPIKSRGFAKKPREGKPTLPPRQLYQETRT